MHNKITVNFANVVFFIFLLLPLIGNQNILFLTVLAKTLNIISYLIICWVLVKVNVRFLMLIGVALLFKVLFFAFGNEVFQTLFWVCTTILIGSFSALYFITATDNFYRFINMYLIITLPIVVLQALGVFDALHSWNTLFLVCDEALSCEKAGTVVNAIGQNFDDLEMSSAQYRPPGLLHSQAILGALIAFALVLNTYSNINRTSVGLIVTIILVVFGMSKIIQVQLVMIAVLIMFQYGVRGISKGLKIILFWLSMLLLYDVLVPGLVSFQLNLDQYIFASGSRLLDFYSFITESDINVISEYKEAIREITNVGVYIASEDDRGGLSGLYQLVWFSPFLFLLLLKVKNIYKKNMGKDFFLQYKLPWKMYLAFLLITITQVMVTDTFGTQFVMFFWGVLAVPIYCTKTRSLNNFRASYKLMFTWR
ncbi:MAG: hypothetical protein QM504_09510 [Pseudomonadota bacterium]